MLDEKNYQQFLTKNPYPRTLKSLEPIQGSSSLYFQQNDQRVINFSSSDYLGLSTHPLLIERSQEYAARFGVGSSASRLVTGNLFLYTELEKKLALALGKPAALILGSGYQTNLSVLEALLDVKVLGQEPIVFCDRFVHVSMLMAVRHLARLHRFQHNSLEHLEKLLIKYQHSTQPKFILVESIYSMDGDQADLAELIYLAKKYNAFLYVDDAHAVGVYGEVGWGSASHFSDEIPLIMGTFSKALGSYGAYVGCSLVLRDYLINKCKGFIYSTSLSPAVLGAISAAIDLLPHLVDERQIVLNYAHRLRHFFREHNLNFGASDTHIVPWIIGDAQLTAKIAHKLEQFGILALPIQPPSVPIGKSRIRFCLSAGHTENDFQCLLQGLLQVLPLVYRGHSEHQLPVANRGRVD